jgi:hypothetical protein
LIGYFIELVIKGLLVKCTGIVQVIVKPFASAMLKTDPNQTEFVDFYFPFNGHLLALNRWVKLVELVPWSEVERCYSDSVLEAGWVLGPRVGESLMVHC